MLRARLLLSQQRCWRQCGHGQARWRGTKCAAALAFLLLVAVLARRAQTACTQSESIQLGLAYPDGERQQPRALLYDEKICVLPGASMTVTLALRNSETDLVSSNITVLAELVYSAQTEHAFRPDPLLAVDVDRRPVLTTSDAQDGAAPVPPLLAPALPQIRAAAAAWDDVAHYTKNPLHSVRFSLNTLSANSNASLVFLVYNLAEVYQNELIAYFRISLIDSVGEDSGSCASYATFQTLERLHQNLNTSALAEWYPEQVCSGRGACPAQTSESTYSASDCECGIGGNSTVIHRGAHCEQEVRALRFGGYTTQLLPFASKQLSFELTRDGPVRVLFYSLTRAKNNRVVLVAKQAFENLGPYTFSSGRGTELPTLYDWSARDNGTQIVKRDDLRKGDVLNVLFENVAIDPADGGESIAVALNLYVLECGLPTERGCPETLEQPLLPMTVLMIVFGVLAVLALGASVYTYYRRPLRWTQGEGLDENGNPQQDELSRRPPRRPKKISEAQIEAAFGREVYASKADDADSTAEQCSVCLSEFEAGEAVRKLPCAHVYHVECIDPWLVARTTCPQCRLLVRSLSGKALQNPQPEADEAQLAENAHQHDESEARGANDEGNQNVDDADDADDADDVERQNASAQRPSERQPRAQTGSGENADSGARTERQSRVMGWFAGLAHMPSLYTVRTSTS